MKLCVKCGVSNVRVIFNGSYCCNCYEDKEEVTIAVVSADLERIEKAQKRALKEKIKGYRDAFKVDRHCGCGVKLGRYERTCSECVPEKNKRFCGCGNELKKFKRICDDCRNLSNSELARERYMLLPEKKVCPICNIEKSQSEFYLDKKWVTLHTYCKVCHKEVNRKNKEKDREGYLEYLRKYNKTYKRKKNDKKDFNPPYLLK